MSNFQLEKYIFVILEFCSDEAYNFYHQFLIGNMKHW